MAMDLGIMITLMSSIGRENRTMLQKSCSIFLKESKKINFGSAVGQRGALSGGKMDSVANVYIL